MLKITQKLLEMLLIRGLPFTEEKEFGAFEAADPNSVIITFTKPVHKDGVTMHASPSGQWQFWAAVFARFGIF